MSPLFGSDLGTDPEAAFDQKAPCVTPAGAIPEGGQLMLGPNRPCDALRHVT